MMRRKKRPSPVAPSLPEAIRGLAASSFPALNSVRDRLRERGVRRIICLGIGDPCRSEAARAQLAFAQCLARAARVADVRFFDPACCAACGGALRAMGVAPLVGDREGRFPADRATLFFMPHCPRFLYHNLLAFNWGSARLAPLLVLGNSFRQYSEKCRLLIQQKRSAIEDLFDAGMIADERLDFAGSDAFSGLSLVSADAARMAQAGRAFFARPPAYMRANPGGASQVIPGPPAIPQAPATTAGPPCRGPQSRDASAPWLAGGKQTRSVASPRF
jgi:hypothetical protein